MRDNVPQYEIKSCLASAAYLHADPRHEIKHEVKLPLNRKLYRVQSVDRALDIMDCFDFQNRQFSLAAI